MARGGGCDEMNSRPGERAAPPGRDHAATMGPYASEDKLLNQIIKLVSGCGSFLGGFLVVWGAVSLGLAIREQQGGAQIASAISTIAGGAIIIAASVYFGMLDTSWLPA